MAACSFTNKAEQTSGHFGGRTSDGAAVADETKAREALLLQLLDGSRIERVEPMPGSVIIKEGAVGAEIRIKKSARRG